MLCMFQLEIQVMKLFLTFLMIFIGKALAMPPGRDNEPPFGYNTFYPIEVQMKCSQVNQRVLCGFDFTNNAKEDYYILKRDTPLDGLNSPYLTISQGNDVMEYAGVIAKMATPTKDDFTFIQAGETVTASIDLTSSYKFTRDGIYTVEYNTPLVYISSREMSMMSNKDLRQASHYEDLVVSTEVEVMDSHNLEPTLAEIESAEAKSTSSEHELVYTNAGCAAIAYTSHGGAGAFTSGIKCVIKKIQTKLCNSNYGIQKALPLKTGPSYVKWFGQFSNTDNAAIRRRNKVYKVLSKMHNGITKATAITYSNGGPSCQANYYAYVLRNNPERKVYLCGLFEKIMDFSCETDGDSKFQTIAHELAHKFGDVRDEQLHGVKQYGNALATALAISHPAKATNNAENYGYFIQDLYDEFYK